MTNAPRLLLPPTTTVAIMQVTSRRPLGSSHRHGVGLETLRDQLSYAAVYPDEAFALRLPAGHHHEGQGMGGGLPRLTREWQHT
jgi:hypothetical protein